MSKNPPGQRLPVAPPVTAAVPNQHEGHFGPILAEFRARAALRVPFGHQPEAPLSPAEKHRVARSVAIFQRGESSEGHTLRRQAQLRVAETGFTDYPEALDCLIREENQHADWLGHFLDLHHLPRLHSHPSDSLFRRARHLGGLELSLTLLRTAEVIAVPYYRALMQASRSEVLRAICRQILKDEARHLRFQQQALQAFLSKRPGWFRAGIRATGHLAMGAAVLLVFFGHRPVWQASGIGLWRLYQRCRQISAVYETKVSIIFESSETTI